MRRVLHESIRLHEASLNDQLAVPEGKRDGDTWRLHTAVWNEAFRLFQGHAMNNVSIAAAFVPHTDGLA